MNLKIGKIASKVGSWTMLSRVFGYIRDMLMAQIFGASAAAEAFQIAFSFPNLFRNLLGEGAMNAALIPKFSQLNAQDKQLARQFLGDVFLLLGGLLIIITALAYIFMPHIISILAWGFEDSDKIALTITLARTCLPYLFCIILVAIFSGILNHAGHFTLPAAIPILLNISLICALIFGLNGTKGFEILWLAKAVVIAGILQLILCIYVAKRAGILPRFSHRLHSAQLLSFLWLLLPGVTSALFLQINLLVNRAFASTLTEGSIVWLFFAERIFQLPLALIGISLGVALLPMLSRAISEHREDDANKLRTQAMKACIFFALPAAFGLLCAAELFVELLFERGAFHAFDTQMTADALQILALGLPAYIFIKVLQPQFFARHDTKTPMFISLFMMLSNVLLAILFIPYLAHVGLALATTLSGWGQVGLLLWKLREQPSRQDKMGQFTLKVLAACICMSASILIVQQYLSDFAFGSLINSSITLFLGVFVYLLAALTLTGYKWHKFFQR